jgi:hypothetical protein
MVISLLRSTYDNYSLNSILLRMLDQFLGVSVCCHGWGEIHIGLRLVVTQMLLPPGMITMVIATTRMHRSLVDFASGSPDLYDTLNFISFLSCSARAMSFQCTREARYGQY